MQRACAQPLHAPKPSLGKACWEVAILCAGVIRKDDRPVDIHSDALCWVATEIPSEQSRHG